MILFNFSAARPIKNREGNYDTASSISVCKAFCCLLLLIPGLQCQAESQF